MDEMTDRRAGYNSFMQRIMHSAAAEPLRICMSGCTVQGNAGARTQKAIRKGENRRVTSGACSSAWRSCVHPRGARSIFIEDAARAEANPAEAWEMREKMRLTKHRIALYDKNR